MTLEDRLERVELALTRWHSRLYRAANTVRKLDMARKRLVEKLHDRGFPPPPAKPAPGLDDRLDDILELDAGLDIPMVLRRTVPNAADEAAKAAILAGQVEAKKARKAASKARSADKLAAKPLTGKAAIAAIRQGV